MTFKQFKNKPVIKVITNKYLLILSVFIVWMVFFDENSILMHREFDKEIIKKLKNKEELEKFAREEYNMKKDNEDIYIIEYDTLNKK